MRRCCLGTVLALTLLQAPPLRAQRVHDEPGIEAQGASDVPGRGVPAWHLARARRGLPPLSPRAAYNHGFQAGLGWSGIMAGPQLVFWSYPFFHLFDMSLDVTPCSGDICEVEVFLAGVGGGGSLVIALLASGAGLAAGVAGTYLVVKHHPGRLPDARTSRAYSSGLIKGVGIGMLATGTLNVILASMFVGGGGGELFHENEDTGHALTVAMLGVGLAQVVGGGVLALVGHGRAAGVLTRVSVSPVALPGGGAVMFGGRF